MIDNKPFPVPDIDHGPLAPLWQAASHGEFRLPRCTDCGTFDWYPTGQCRQCQGRDIAWERLSGRASLFSWALVNRALHKPLIPLAPYISAIVVIEEDGLTRFVTRLIDSDPSALRAGMPAQVCFNDLGYPAIETGVMAPLFTTNIETTRDKA